MYFWHTMKWYSHCVEFPDYEATNMLEKASQLRLGLRIHRTNPLSYNENLLAGFRNFPVLYSRTNYVPTALNFN